MENTEVGQESHIFHAIMATQKLDSLADRLKWARDQKGLSQAALAKAAGIKTAGAIGHLETGVRGSSMRLPQIADALGVSAIWLAEGVGDPYEQEDTQTQQGEFSLEWVNEEERDLLNRFRSADSEGRKLIQQVARHVVALPSNHLRRGNKP